MKKFDTINVVPFIDILLVLLAIVLTTSTFIAQGTIKVDLPKSTQTAPINPQSYKISITSKGIISFQDEQITIEEFSQKLVNIDKGASFTLFCDKEAKFDYFVLILEQLKSRSFENIDIATEK
ncbi:MAG: biopolymer transporter ExbD [Campylobacteraceae bacterium]|nr:biopolymer transporter ExbD [Campylobacteraceae bacterium]